MVKNRIKDFGKIIFSRRNNGQEFGFFARLRADIRADATNKKVMRASPFISTLRWVNPPVKIKQSPIGPMGSSDPMSTAIPGEGSDGLK